MNIYCILERELITELATKMTSHGCGGCQLKLLMNTRYQILKAFILSILRNDRIFFFWLLPMRFFIAVWLRLRIIWPLFWLILLLCFIGDNEWAVPFGLAIMVLFIADVRPSLDYGKCPITEVYLCGFNWFVRVMS